MLNAAYLGVRGNKVPALLRNILVAFGIAFMAIVALLFLFSSNCDYKLLAASMSPSRIYQAKYELRQCDGDSAVTAYIGIEPLSSAAGRHYAMRSIGTYRGSVDDLSTGWPTLALSWKDDHTLVLELGYGDHLDFYGDELNGVSIQILKP